jgi:hypothetical protein
MAHFPKPFFRPARGLWYVQIDGKPELQQMFRAFSDVQTAEMLNLPRPRLQGGKPIVVA